MRLSLFGWTRPLLVAGAVLFSASGGVLAASADAPSPGTATPEAIPFTGNLELKTRLDAAGKPTIAGERLHAWLLRRFRKPPQPSHADGESFQGTRYA